MNISTRPIMVAAVLGALVFSSAAQADSKKDYVYDEVVEKAKKKKIKEGWGASVSLGANVSMGHASSVVGKPEGLTLALGLDFAGALNWSRGGHEWRNSMTVTEMFSKTPTIDGVSKTADKLYIESIYLYHFERFPWIGPFGRFAWETSAFPGNDMQADEFTYKVTMLDGTSTASRDTSFRVTDAFKPMMFKESIGAFAKPYTAPWANIEFRLGIGGRQVLAADQFAVSKVDKDTKTISVKELQDYAEAGGEFTAYVWGKYYDGKVSYKVGAEVLIPFANTADTGDRSAADLTNIEFLARLSFKLVSWASLEYEFAAKRIPMLQEDWQITNSLFLSFAYSNLWGTMIPEKKKE